MLAKYARRDSEGRLDKSMRSNEIPSCVARSIARKSCNLDTSSFVGFARWTTTLAPGEKASRLRTSETAKSR
jgi:hypothetical protein